MGYVPKLAKNSLYVAIKVSRVKVEHVLVQCVLVQCVLFLSISQLFLIFLMICDLYGCPIIHYYPVEFLDNP